MEDEKTAELKNKIAELKQRLNQLYAQYFSDAREGKVFETEFSLYLKASEVARREKNEHLGLQFGIVKTGFITLIASTILIIFFFGQHIFFSTFFLLGLSFLACGLMYLMLASEIKIARARRFCIGLGEYFQQYRWSTESSQSVRLPDIPLWDDFAIKGEPSGEDRNYEAQALYLPFRIAVAFIDLLALALLIQSALPGDAMTSRIGLLLCLILWFVAVPAHMMLVDSLVRDTERIRHFSDTEAGEDRQSLRIRRRRWSLVQMFRIFFLLDVIFPKALKPPGSHEKGHRHRGNS